MEGKNVILSVLIISLVMAQIQVEAKKKSCPTKHSSNCFIACRLPLLVSEEYCAKQCGCTLVDKLPTGIFENSGDAKNEYCKLGCVFSVCDAMVTLRKNNPNEIVNGAVEQCAKACSTVCTKDFETAVETA